LLKRRERRYESEEDIRFSIEKAAEVLTRRLNEHDHEHEHDERD
jgi:hypothetical protein